MFYVDEEIEDPDPVRRRVPMLQHPRHVPAHGSPLVWSNAAMHNAYVRRSGEAYRSNGLGAETEIRSGDSGLIEEGHRVIIGIIHTLTNLRANDLYENQMDMAKLAIPTTFKYVYGEVYLRRKAEILKAHCMTDSEDCLCVFAQRRAGKTRTIALFVLAVATNVRKNLLRPFRAAIFALNQEASKRFIKDMTKAWHQINMQDKFHFEGSSFRMKLTSKTDPTDVRTIEAFCTGKVCNIYFLIWVNRRKRKMVVCLVCMIFIRFSFIRISVVLFFSFIIFFLSSFFFTSSSSFCFVVSLFYEEAVP